MLRKRRLIHALHPHKCNNLEFFVHHDSLLKKVFEHFQVRFGELGNLGRLLLDRINLLLEDFATFDKDSESIRVIISKFQTFFETDFPSVLKAESRTLHLSILEDLVIKLVRSSSMLSVSKRSEERFDRLIERKRELPDLKGKSTSLVSQYKFQLLDYLIFGNGTVLRGLTPYISHYQAFDFVANLILVLQLDNSQNYDLLNLNEENYLDSKKRIHEVLRTDYSQSYIPGTLEGFPKGVRLNSAFGGPRIIEVKQ